MEILQRRVQAGGVIIVRAYCGHADGNSGSRVWKMFQIFLIAAQRRDRRALAVPIVPVVTQGILLEIPLPLQERPGRATAAAAARLRLVLVLRPVARAGVLPLAVPVLLAVRLPLVLHPPVLEPHFHLLLR